MKRSLTALTVAASLIASGASAFESADWQKLLDTNECVECDLSRASLRETSLRVANLSRANLSRADLIGANLSGATLWEADLTKVIMNGAILCNTTMPDGSVIYSGC